MAETFPLRSLPLWFAEKASFLLCICVLSSPFIKTLVTSGWDCQLSLVKSIKLFPNKVPFLGIGLIEQTFWAGFKPWQQQMFYNNSLTNSQSRLCHCFPSPPRHPVATHFLLQFFFLGTRHLVLFLSVPKMGCFEIFSSGRFSYCRFSVKKVLWVFIF